MRDVFCLEGFESACCPSDAARCLQGCERAARQLAAVVAPLVSEVRHPPSLDFANERKTLLLRDVHGLSWAAIQKQVVNLRGKTPSARLLQQSQHQDVSRDLWRRVHKYNNCGRKTTKASAAVQKYPSAVC